MPVKNTALSPNYRRRMAGVFLKRIFAELARRVDRPAFGLTLDLGHLHCQGETPIAVHLERWRDLLWNVHVEDMRRGVHDHLMFGEGEIDLTLDGVMSRIVFVIEGHELYLRTRNGRFELHWVDPFGGETEEQAGEDKIVAPLPGTVVALLAEEGAKLEKGAPILTLEVMKMEQTLRAPYAGVLKKIKCKVGDIVGEGVELAEVEPAAS